MSKTGAYIAAQQSAANAEYESTLTLIEAHFDDHTITVNPLFPMTIRLLEAAGFRVSVRVIGTIITWE